MAKSDAPKQPGPGLRISLILLIAGAVVAIGCGVVGSWRLAGELLNAPRHAVPGTFSVSLDKGPNRVYELTGKRSGGGGFTVTRSHGVTLTPEQVTITGPDGRDVPVRQLAVSSSTTETIDIKDDKFSAALAFDAPTDGTYEVRVDDSSATTVIVAHSVLNRFKAAVWWFVVAGVAGLVGFVGLVMLIVGLVRRGRAAKSALAYGYGAPGGVPPYAASYQPGPYADPRTAGPYAGAPPPPAGPQSPAGPQPSAGPQPDPGWYPDPAGSGSARYWDGQAWH